MMNSPTSAIPSIKCSRALEKSQHESAEQNTRLSIMVERMPAVLWTTDTDLKFVSSMGAGPEGPRPPDQ